MDKIFEFKMSFKKFIFTLQFLMQILISEKREIIILLLEGGFVNSYFIQVEILNFFLMITLNMQTYVMAH